MTQERKRRVLATDAAASISRMVRDMIATTHRARQEGKKLAYTFIYCCYDEILRAMDIVPVWTENYAGICGAKRDAERFMQRAQAENLSRSLCAYALCDIGFDAWREELGEMPEEPPWGGLVKPDMMLGSGQMICDPRTKWFQAAQHYMPDVPVFEVGLPWIPYEQDYRARDVEDYYVRYIVEQLRSLVKFLEEQTQKKMDWERLSELVDLSDRTWNLVVEAYELRRATPCPMDTGDAMSTMVPLTFMMGTRQAYDFFEGLYNELKLRVAAKQGVVPDEKYRILWGGGLPSWYALSDFDYFHGKGAVFPAETTYRLIEPVYELDLPPSGDPIEHLAWRWTRYWTFWHDKARRRPCSHPDVERLIQYIEDYDIDGILMHEAFSCRSWHPGLIWQLAQLKNIYRDIPSLVLESDIIDIGSYNEADTRSRIDTFIDILSASQ
ncbi:MAG: 2-hydroxyacyl-CoA dehydratase [Chloroflexi bacterium]|nr:2-hydroxyacyl-CoA dehydratase [Chloroflexota bacterium]